MFSLIAPVGCSGLTIHRKANADSIRLNCDDRVPFNVTLMRRQDEDNNGPLIPSTDADESNDAIVKRPFHDS